MTQNQLEWMQQSGLDPAEYDMTPDGRVVRRQPAQPVQPVQQKMSIPRAFGTSFTGSLVPTGGAMAASAPFLPLAAANPLVGIPVMLGAGLAGSYGAGKLQEKALEEFAPGALQELARAEQDQPVASYLGGFAPSALAFKPSLKGIEGLSAPLMRGRDIFTKFDPATTARFVPAAANVGVNTANATAAQLLNMSQGGEFSAPRFAADVALGSVFTNPNALGRKMGFPSLTPETAPVERLDLAGEQARRAGVAAEQARAAALAEDEAAAARATELLGTKTPVEETPVLDTRRSNIERNRENITRELERMSKQKPPEDLVQDLANDPFIPGEDPTALQEWLAGKAEKYLDSAYKAREAAQAETPEYLGQEMGAARERAEAFAPEGGTRVAPETWTPEGEAVPVSDEAKLRTAEAAEKYLAQTKEQGNPRAIKAAQEIYDEVYARLQRPSEEGVARITQEDLDVAAEIAAKRGLKLTFADLEGGRGSFQLETPDGRPLIKIDPAAASRDTAIHEIGHDVFARSVGEGMRKGLMATAEDSPAFKAEFEARMAARDEQGNPKYTEQQARDLALEEGVIQSFGEKYPNIQSGEIRQWFNALKTSLKDLVGMKLSPEDSAAYLHYLTHEAVPWKGAAVAKVDVAGEERMQRAPQEGFSALDKETRYQRGLVGQGKDILSRLVNFSELDNLEARGGIYATVAKAMKGFYATRNFMQGQAAAKEKAMASLTPERQVMLGKHIGQEFDQRRFIQPPSEIAAAYNEYRNEWQKFWPDAANKAGHTIRTAGGQRARLTDPYYGPFHMWSENVRDILTTKQGSPEYVKLQDDYIKQHVKFHQQNGIPLQEAQTRAAAEFADEVRTMSVPYDPTAAGTFAGARKAQGIPLPDSWREYNIMKLVENYDRRSATDFAMQEHMEKSPEVMAALGAKTYFNDQPIPTQVKAVVPDISSDQSVQSILREMSGKPARKSDDLTSGVSRNIGALTIGTVSKATEVPTTMIAGLRYLQGSDYLTGTLKFIEKLGDWAALKERSYASGLNKRDGAQTMRQVAGVGEDAAGYMNKFAEGVSKYTGLSKLEQAARTMAQGWGEVLVQINKRKASTGDKEAVRMLDTLSPDWRTRSDADLAAQFGRLMQGSYDMTQLPAWILESGAAPYLTWSKWSAGQYNNFVKFAIEPALQGNVKPLLGHLLIGVLGGAAVDQVREWMNNRQSRDINWNELESWMQQNQGQLGAEGMKQLTVKLLNIVQNVGTFGIAGDLAKMVTTAAVSGTAQGMATAPVANAVFDTSKKVAAALKAIDDGEDFGLVLRQMLLDVAKTHVQVARVGLNYYDTDENLRYDDRRRRRLYDELTGVPTQSGTFSVNYGNLGEREFERGAITEKTGEEALGLVSRAREQATTPEDYASRIRKLKTSQNAIMPSLERQPLKAARYLSWLEGTEEGLGGETMRRYLIREQEDKYRKSLVEGLSGLR